LLITGNLTYGQCLSSQSFTLNPVGPYVSGQVVNVTYTLGDFNGINTNWIHAFQINLGVGWTNLTPIINPGNPGGSNGNWIWDIQHTYNNGFNFGPGWRFVNSGTSGWGTTSDGPFTMSFQLTVAQTCTADDLGISMEVFDDCITGGWNNGSCCNDPSYNIYNGTTPDLNTSNSTTITHCGSSYTWSVNNQTYFTSGTYTNVSTNAAGCIHTDTLNLIIHPISVNGCTDPLACNYDPLAICDDNSCVYDVSNPLVTNTCPGVSSGAINVSVSPVSLGTIYTYSINGATPNVYNIATNNLSSGSYTYEFFVNGISCGVQPILVGTFNSTVVSINTTDETCLGNSDGTAGINTVNVPPGTVSILSYCPSSPNTGFFSGTASAIIENVVLNGDNNNINNNTAGAADSYEDYTATMYADLTEGQAYTVDVTLNGLGAPGSTQNYSGAKVYIDYNINGDFTDPGEEVGVIPYTNAATIGTAASIIFTVPTTGVYGPTRMRVVSQYLGGASPNSSVIGPCDFAGGGFGTPWYGATEDYSIVLNSTTNNASYLWSNGATSNSINNLSSGSYSVQIIDGNACISTQNFTIYSGAQGPSAFAGLPVSICEGLSYTLNGAYSLNNAGVNWTTSGTGTFIGGSTLTPTYTPSTNDISLGSVILTLTAIGNSPCGDVISTVILTIDPIPITVPITHN
jgi:hypothetical protein